jgi:hypothetical protein
MSDNVNNLILEHLKALRNEAASLPTEMHDEFQEVKHRLTQLETMTTRARADTVQ